MANENKKPAVRLTEQNRYSHIIARAWSDAEFKKRLLSEASSVFAEYELEVPTGTTIRVVENTPDTLYFVLPAKPTSLSHLSLDRLPVTIMDSPCAHSDCAHSGQCEGPCSGCHCGGGG